MDSTVSLHDIANSPSLKDHRAGNKKINLRCSAQQFTNHQHIPFATCPSSDAPWMLGIAYLPRSGGFHCPWLLGLGGLGRRIPEPKDENF